MQLRVVCVRVSWCLASFVHRFCSRGMAPRPREGRGEEKEEPRERERASDHTRARRAARAHRVSFVDATSPSIANASSVLAWSLLAVIFAAALWHRTDFASTKDTATAWGAIIGLAAFFAWLAVDIEEEDDDAANNAIDTACHEEEHDKTE